MEPFLGGVYLVSFNFEPNGYAFCNGQTLSISTNTALFALVGTYYGGNGSSTFALPDLRGRVPIHQGQQVGGIAYNIGQVGGAETATLTVSQMPAHNHTMLANTSAPTTAVPTGAYFAAGIPSGSGPNASQLPLYGSTLPNASLGGQTIHNTGGGQPFSVLNPYLCMSWVIALQGVFPSRN